MRIIQENNISSYKQGYYLAKKTNGRHWIKAFQAKRVRCGYGMLGGDSFLSVPEPYCGYA